MKIFYEEYKQKKLKEKNINKTKIQNLIDMKDFTNNKIEFFGYKTRKYIINNNEHNYLHQTSSSLSKIKKSKSSEKNKSTSQNHNKGNKNYKKKINSSRHNLENNQFNRIITKNINDYNSFQNRVNTFLNNQKSNINKEKSGNGNEKNLFHTLQNFNKYFPKPEPMPKKLNYNESINNNIINKNENMKDYDENLNSYDKREDKNILYLLTNLNLQNLYKNFTSNCINFTDLFLLTKGDFVEMNIPIGPRNRILHFIYEYKKIGKKYDFNELSNFLNYYKKIINKPLISEINNELFISTNNINNKSFGCFNKPIINNFLNKTNDYNNKKIKINNESIEAIILSNDKLKEINNLNNKQNKNKLIKNHESENEKNDLIRHNLFCCDSNLLNKSNEKNKNHKNFNNIKLKKYNSVNFTTKNISEDIPKKVYNNYFADKIKNSNYNINVINKKENNKTISSKNLKNIDLKNIENNKQNDTKVVIKYKSFFDKKGYNKNLLLNNTNNTNNSNNSTYLLEKIKNSNNTLKLFEKNSLKIKKKEMDEKLSSYFNLQKNSEIDESLLFFLNKDLENENIRNLNYELKQNYQKNYNNLNKNN